MIKDLMGIAKRSRRKPLIADTGIKPAAKPLFEKNMGNCDNS
jgi:hypothetical protein